MVFGQMLHVSQSLQIAVDLLHNMKLKLDLFCGKVSKQKPSVVHLNLRWPNR